MVEIKTWVDLNYSLESDLFTLKGFSEGTESICRNHKYAYNSNKSNFYQ